MNQKIAIIGMSGLFPGSSTNEAFWENLLQGKDLTSKANEEDFGVAPDNFFQDEKGIIDKCYSLRGGYIRDFEFEAEGYALSADFLSKQDKLYQWSIYVAREALAHSGYFDKKEVLQKCGVILGNLSFPTGSSHKQLASIYTETTAQAIQQILNEPDFKIQAHTKAEPQNEVLAYTPSQMVVEALQLGGTHYALDAACATSLYAIKLACDELILGKADMMLAGAVCASDQLFIHMGFSIFHAYAPHDKKFVPLDKDSAGLVSSEGAGMVVLKRLEDAQRDGDHILGVIGGIGLSNDGRGKFLLSPNPKGQRLAFERAYEAENISPANTSYLECHATGTPLGDVTELNSIANFFEDHQVKPLLGSVKSNMGHLLTAAGMTGLLKVLLALEKEVIPPNINLENALHAENGWIGGNQMIAQATEWRGENRQAGINSFGFGGTNAHMVVTATSVAESFSEDKSATKVAATMAIVGMDAHFGDCTNLEDFYKMIFEGKQHFKELPKSRWKGFEENEQLLRDYGFKNGKAPKGAYIEDFEIDLLRYKIQPQEAETLEPQQALILKVADNALKDAGLAESQNVAVLIAMESELAIHHYLARWDATWQLKEAIQNSGIELTHEQQTELEEATKNAMYFRQGSQSPSQHTSFVGNIMASRIAALWDFSGPAFTVSCGDNSAFKALEVAQNLLALGEVEAVVVGGVDFAGGLENVLLRNKENPVNRSDMPSLSLNVQEEGWLVGEGAGAIVLKREADVGEGKIYAVVDGVGSHGKDTSFEYMELASSELPPTPSYKEGESSPKRNPYSDMTPSLFKGGLGRVALGSIQTNIGNTGAASGIASIIKTALCLHHQCIPGIPNWEAPKTNGRGNPCGYPNDNDNPYYFPTESRPWIKSKVSDTLEVSDTFPQRRAVVVGEEGIQVQLSEATKASDTLKVSDTFMPNLFLLKGNSEKELQTQLAAVEIAIETELDLPVLAQQFYAKANKKESDYCIVLIATNKTNLQQEIQFFKKTLSNAFQKKSLLKTPKGSYFTPKPIGKKGKIAFVYPGSASTYPKIGQTLFQLFPNLLAHFEEQVDCLDDFVCSDYLYPKTITKGEGLNVYDNAIALMSAGVFYATAYTKILRDLFKVEPNMAFGYSMGECSSMYYATDMWAPENAKEFRESPIFLNGFAGRMEVLSKHWNISSEEAKASWVSYVLLAPKENVVKALADFEKASLTFINTDNQIVISGDKTACDAIIKQLGCPSIPIPFQNIIHHKSCRIEEEGLIKIHDFPLLTTPNIDFYSSITHSKIPMDSEAIARNSTEVCCNAVDFPKIVRTVYQDGARVFIEVGANATCTGWIKEILKEEEHLAVSIDIKGKTAAQAIPELLAQLVSHGVEIDLSALYPAPKTTKAPRRFLKKIVVGGKRIFDLLREGVAGCELRVAGSTSSKADCQSAINYTGTDYQSVLLQTTKEKINTKLMDQDLTTPTKVVKDSQPQPATRNSQFVTAENGLRIHDFTTTDHLKEKNIVFTQQDLEEFATGKIANVFGEAYSIIDTYSRRVMLPMYPYLLVSRVTGLKGQVNEYKPSTMQTEYDIPHGAWFTTDRQIPWAVSVESGQCDLLLISYLGIDFQNKGNLVYRLLDCTLTFVDDLPFEGQTLRYDISINSFVKNGENLLFFFSYRCFVEDRLVLKMDGGCAGFFRDEQLEEGNGVVYTDAEIAIRQKAKKKHFTPLLTSPKTSFSIEDLRHLINGDMEKCFEDESYFLNGRNPSLRLPPEKILMIDRITSVDSTGGAYGLGYIVAEKDLHPDDWYFPCHFRDDEVLAGSLQAEGGGNLLRFFMLYLGLQRLVKDARYQPVYDLPQKVRCRKQVVPGKDTKLIYKLEIKEIGLIPNPYVIGDLEIISNGVVTVHFENLGLQLREKSNPKYLETTAGVYVSPRSEGALLDEKAITTFALDNLSECFGEEFAVYDGRKVSRQPNTDLQVISRIVKIDGERHNFKQPSTAYAEYDVPVDAWYYEQNSAITMPYSILMEIALQPCGLLGAYLGSTLKFPDKNLYFRNLDGEGQLFDLPAGTDFRGKTITNKAVLASSVALGGTILQNYTFECAVDGQVFYKGKSSFGFFPADALASQVGLDKGEEVLPWYKTENLSTQDYMQIKLDSLYGKMKLAKAPADKPHYRLAEDQLTLVDNLRIAKDQGQYGKGYIHATKFVKPYEWFFTCHFYQDPVMPGSLGVEAIHQAMQVFALQQDLGKDFQSPKFVQLPNHTTQWKYRGQILTHVKEMHLEVHIKTIERRGAQLAIIGDAYLWNEGMRIYSVSDLGIGIEEG